MSSTGRLILSVLAGAALWALLWSGGMKMAAALFPDVLDPTAERLRHAGALAGYLAYGASLNVLAGFVTALLSQDRAPRAIWALAALQLVLGAVNTASAWEVVPLWFHLTYLVLIVPTTLLGGRIWISRRSEG